MIQEELQKNTEILINEIKLMIDRIEVEMDKLE